MGASTTAAVALCAVLGPPALGGSSSAIDSEWVTQRLNDSPPPDALQNNLVGDALADRDRATADWKQAASRYEEALREADAAPNGQRARLRRQAEQLKPDPHAKPEYAVVWSSNQNAGDMNTRQAITDVGKLTSDPTAPADDLPQRLLPGLDGFVVVDARRRNVDGTPNPTYGKVVNFAQLPAPWGVETEAHHMQYEWQDGQPIFAGGLFNSTTFVVGVKDVPSLDLVETFPPSATPTGSIPDAYDYAGQGRFYGTYMGGPLANYAGSPGEIVTFKPDGEGGYVVASEVAAGQPQAREIGNPGGVPEPCGVEESLPLGTCANPHGIQVRPDLDRMITSDYGEPRMVVLDPIKPPGGAFFRPTVRIWDTSDVDNPELISVAHMPNGWRPPSPTNTMLQNRGIMEAAKTWPVTDRFPQTLESKGVFSGAMCGGGIFFAPDITALEGDSTRQWRQVWDDGISLVSARNGDVTEWMNDQVSCEGGAWMQVSRNNRWLFRTVGGGAPNQDNLYSNGQPNKIVYSIDVEPLVRSAQDGAVTCDLANGMDLDGDGRRDITGPEAVKQLAEGEQVADCPRLLSTLNVDDRTTGGPHWGAFDNHSYTADGSPTRLLFSNYFVARSGIDGNHRLHMANVDPETGKLSYDESWRDELTGERGVNFNREDWPGNPGAGFYKPHSMVWVCPPEVCPPDDEP